jgi:hypothetical protein
MTQVRLTTEILPRRCVVEIDGVVAYDGDDLAYANSLVNVQLWATQDTAKEPTPHELWVEAKGDREAYLSLLRKHRLLVPRTETPKPHAFNGLTPACLCVDCQGRFDAPWHDPRA